MLSGISDSTAEQVKCFNREDEINDNENIAVIIGIDKEWEKMTCCNLFNKHIHPIIVFPSGDISSLPYSCITTDDFFTFSELTSLLLTHSKKGIALAGLNPASSIDIIKYKGFRHALALAKTEFNPEYVFKSNDNISECVENLVAARDKFDTIICVNDITAILACAKLPNPGDYNITGFSGMLCTRYTNPKITTIGIDYYMLGCAIVEAYNNLKKNDFMLKQSLYVKSKLILGETTPKLTDDNLYGLKALDTYSYNKPLMVYDDSVFKELDTVEMLIQKSDDIDIKILRMLANNKKYEEISAELFLSITPLKYRIGKMLRLAQLDTKKQLVNVLRKYNIFT